MLRIEAIPERHIQNLLLHGTAESPQVVLPEIRSIEPITSLASLPQAFDVLPKRSRPYAIYDTRQMWPVPPRAIELAPVSVEEPFAATTTTVAEPSLIRASLGLVAVTGLDLGSPGDFNRKTDRQMLRIRAFRRLINRVNEERERLDGITSGDEFETTQLYIKWLQRSADALRTELSQEPFTQTMADDMVKNTLPEKAEVVVEGAEDILRKTAFTEANVVAAVENILFPPAGKKIDKDAPELATKAKITHQKEVELDRPEFLEEKVKTQEVENREIAQELTVKETLKKSGDVYVNDPIMDRPSSEAAAFFEELWNRPF